MNAHECRQNWASVIINLHRAAKTTPREMANRSFGPCALHSVPVTSFQIGPNLDRNVAHWSHIHTVPGES